MLSYILLFTSFCLNCFSEIKTNAKLNLSYKLFIIDYIRYYCLLFNKFICYHIFIIIMLYLCYLWQFHETQIKVPGNFLAWEKYMLELHRHICQCKAKYDSTRLKKSRVHQIVWTIGGSHDPATGKLHISP